MPEMIDLNTSSFEPVLLNVKPGMITIRSTATFKLIAPDVPPSSTVAVVGKSPRLGAWDPKKSIPLVATSDSTFVVHVALEPVDFTSEYKYIIIGDDVTWESGENRELDRKVIPFIKSKRGSVSQPSEFIICNDVFKRDKLVDGPH